MKKILIILNICIIASTTSFGQSKKSPLTYDKGIVINGVKWATRNVDKPGTFAVKPEDAGLFYQWNRKVAWSATVPDLGKVMPAWDSTIPEGDTWTKVNDPSPIGWRIPTLVEIKSLFDTTKVSHEWTTENGVSGRKFTDKATGNTLFLPAVGYRHHEGGALNGVGSLVHYWSSSTAHEREYAFYFLNSSVTWHNTYRRNGFSVRAVAETKDFLKYSKDTLVDKCFEYFFSNFTYNKEFQLTRNLTDVMDRRIIRQPVNVVDMSKLYKTQFYNYVGYLYNSHEKVEYCKELTNKKYLSILKPTENKKTIVSFNKIGGCWFLVDIANFYFDFDDVANFEAFIYRFSTDSIFRNEHIRFPLKYDYLDDDKEGYPRKTGYLTEENVFQFDFFDNDEFVFLHSNEINNEERILVYLGGVENGISVFYYFEKFDDEWVLIEYDNYSM